MSFLQSMLDELYSEYFGQWWWRARNTLWIIFLTFPNGQKSKDFSCRHWNGLSESRLETWFWSEGPKQRFCCTFSIGTGAASGWWSRDKKLVLAVLHFILNCKGALETKKYERSTFREEVEIRAHLKLFRSTCSSPTVWLSTGSVPPLTLTYFTV